MKGECVILIIGAFVLAGFVGLMSCERPPEPKPDQPCRFRSVSGKYGEDFVCEDPHGQLWLKDQQYGWYKIEGIAP